MTISRPLVGGDFQREIKAADEVRRLVGPRPRARRVVMCHGTFDIVHPGHIRHLIYARDKGEILVVSLTADVHISKGKFRPFVPAATVECECDGNRLVSPDDMRGKLGRIEKRSRFH